MNQYHKTIILDENYFSEIDSDSKAYILGYLYADGCNTRKGFSATIKESDVELLYFICDEIKRVKNLYEIFIKNNKYYTLCIVSKKISDDLSKHGCIPKKSLLLKEPNINSIYFNSFIRGYFDGDGCISIRENKYATISFVGTNIFLKWLKDILEEWRISSSIYDINHSYAKELKFSDRESVIKFYKKIYNNGFFLKRKKEKFNIILNLINNIKLEKKSIFLGVYKKGNKYIASISVKNKNIYIGTFNTEEDANNARINYEKENFIGKRRRRSRNIGSTSL